MPASLILSTAAHARIERASQWLAGHLAGLEVYVVPPTLDAANALLRQVARKHKASFGWHRVSLGRLAAGLAAPELTRQGLLPASPLALEALCSRVVHAADDPGRFASIVDRPGLPRALLQTFRELRMMGYGPQQVPADLRGLFQAYLDELAASHLVDRARVFEVAAEVARDMSSHARPTLLLDLRLEGSVDAGFVKALLTGTDDVLITMPVGDERSLRYLNEAAGDLPTERLEPSAGTALGALQSRLFAEPDPDAAKPKRVGVHIFSTPGESLECVEIARRIHREAAAGVPFDRMAILLRNPTLYRGHLEEAMRRASIPTYFAHGTVKPDPSGRAFLSLLACAADDLSATRFAEYLSLSQAPTATTEGEPPPALPSEEAWAPPDSELVPESLEIALIDIEAGERADADELTDEDAPVVGGTLRAPRRWERLLMDAAVIGGLDRWRRRLESLKKEREFALNSLDDIDDPMREVIARDLAAMDSLQKFALPILEALDALPESGTWAQWLEGLSALATRALRRPERVLATLAELVPMRDVGPVDLSDVRLVLGRRLTDLLARPSEKEAGRVFVAEIESARGLSFDVVFVPGLAEKLFPEKLIEDPILADSERVQLDGLATHRDRAAQERFLLRASVGAASQAVYISYPRLDVNASRPRVPSFYGLEVLRASEGALPGFEELMERARAQPTAQLGWPAPAHAEEAIDEAEHDLALLSQIFEQPDGKTTGMARYLLEVNPHLTRALRFRARRWHGSWTPADGLIKANAGAVAALAKHNLNARSYSPTALQNFAQCPYKFFLYAVLRLKPKEPVFAIDVMNPLQRGSLVHEVLYELHVALRKDGLLPVTSDNIEDAREVLERTIGNVTAYWEDLLNPIVPRVWEDELALIKGDLAEWLRREVYETRWTPAHFELAFGLPKRIDKDAASVDDPVKLDCGIQLRGSIDLVERSESGRLRATDYKTGQARVKQSAVISGGEALQPVLYALALEKIFEKTEVDGGRLYYCTTAGNFEMTDTGLNPRAREAANAVADTIGEGLENAFLPAAPRKGACRWCDYKPICGPYEEFRVRRKPKKALKTLEQLRSWT